MNNRTVILASAASILIFSFLCICAMPMLFLTLLLGGGSMGSSSTLPEDLVAIYDDFVWPLRGYGSEYITSPFGYRASPGGIGSTNHKGVDIAAPKGTPIRAAASGAVTISSYNSTSGHYVEVDHGNGLRTRYAHMSKRLCNAGILVDAGDILGLVGSTGVSTGNHLHFELRLDGVAHDPMQLFYSTGGEIT